MFMNTMWSLGALVAYGSSLVPTEQLWIAGFISMAIPFFLLAHVMWLVYWLVVRPPNAMLSGITLLLGWSFIVGTIGKPFARNAPGDPAFKVLSYNVRVFNSYKHLSTPGHSSTKDMIAWMQQREPDVLCMQEFYLDRKKPIFNTIPPFRAVGLVHHYFEPMLTNWAKAQFGLAIFSRYPIIAKGSVEIPSYQNNQIIYADIKMPQGVVRVYNIHLQSMSISEGELSTGESREETKRNVRSVARKLKNGFVYRSRQVDQLIKSVEASPYPVIICGDLNDLPYSNTYRRLDSMLKNGFEEAGSGLGVTYNGKIPFLRIDNQFASRSFNIHYFTTHNLVEYSDHYPIEAGYSFKK
jgi:endonuclease/exonuclease/phosphatase family metal-dependent hydrolase